MSRSKTDILLDYQQRKDQQQNHIDSLRSQLSAVSLFRLGAFLAEILLVAVLIKAGYSVLLLILLFLPMVVFVLLVKKQTDLQSRLDYALKLLWVIDNEIECSTSGKNGYGAGEDFIDDHHPYSSDLDVFGPGSLFSLINRCKTTDGRALLASAFLSSSPKAGILDRQQAVEELSSHFPGTLEFRADLQDHQPEQLDLVRTKLQSQLPAQLRFTHHKILRVYVRLAPIGMFSLLVLGGFFGGVVWSIFALFALANAGLTLFYLAQVNLVYYGFSGSANLLQSFSGAIKWTEHISWKSRLILRLFAEDGKPDKVSEPISSQVKQLTSIIQSFDARLNILLAAILNVFLLWDLRYSIKLNDWHARSSKNLLKGLYRISQFEELISLATLRHNEPAWQFPEIAGDFSFEVQSVGHPLIADHVRVCNDFHLREQPTVDIITGSNMAGKSTFLRTLGVNMVLAYSGAPVCAMHMKVSVFSILSYMRIRDSLNDQTSTFKAELNRLKMILERTRLSSDAFVLIDEMLRGTNSRDKFLGSKVFIEKLLSQKTPALFATHDLQLSEMEVDHPAGIRNYHFDIQMNENQMEFDYLLKLGPCKTFNAALLLKQIGLTLN